MKIHRVKQGECLRELGLQYGIDWRKIRDHSQNRKLMAARHEAVLHPGDEVTIPEPTLRVEHLQTHKIHKFVYKLERRRPLEMRLVEADDDPLARADYEIQVGNETLKGRTDDDGILRETVPLGARLAQLRIEGIEVTLLLGALNPLRETPDKGATGLQQRLANLGYDVGPDDAYVGPRTMGAVFDFDDSCEPAEEIPAGVDLTLGDAHGS